MWKSFCRWVLYDLLGWVKSVTVLTPDKCIICLAPHTSNWDFVIGQLFAGAEGLKANFLMKEEWFFWPLGFFFKHLGGIPVCRSKHTNMTDQLAETAKKSKSFRLCITPEGTRALTADWKKGFYYIALKANIPIILYGIDYEVRNIGCTKKIIPNGDIEEQMREIKQHYLKYKGLHPEKFTIGDV